MSSQWRKELIQLPADSLPQPRIRSTAPAVKVGPFLFISGQSGRQVGEHDNYSADPAEQASQTMENIRTILEAAGSSFEHVLKRTIFVRDAALYAAMRPVVDSYFTSPVASTSVQTGFLHDKLIEVEVLALVPDAAES
jgi:2-iminobutanoate/2-iminopropanoate deaminase